MEKIQSFLYKTAFGRIILKILIQPPITKLGGLFLSTKFSARFVPGFVKRNNIDMADYEKREYKSFNDFFTRKVCDGKRPISKDFSDLISPCDSALTVYKLNETSVFNIKSSVYTVDELLMDNKDDFKNGLCLVFRLAVDNYHRYCFIDNGTLEPYKKIKGVFHTVMPISEKYNVFSKNSREWTVLHTENFSDVAQIEVGALMVGKISNRDVTAFKKGEEKGKFEFGGSTIIVVLKEDVAQIRQDILDNSEKGIETKVKYGEIIGKALDK